ncbi:MAG: radical SAM protein [Bacillota bacterium]
MRIFGPVPSRRLGKSLGINNVRPKTCSYSCVYCQLGITEKMQLKREEFYTVQELQSELEQTLKNLDQRKEKLDYITFVADGEPTLDKNLGKSLKMIKETTGVKTAVISNASLISKKEVREELKEADWVSLKCDAVSEKIWRKVDRPHGKLDISKIQKGMKEFSKEFEGKFVTETMLVEGINDKREELEKVADFIAELDTDSSYVAIPTRPPAEEEVSGPKPEKINMAVQIFKERGIKTEYLIGYEGNEFSSTGDLKKDLLNITSVHPLKEEAVEELIKKCDSSWNEVEELINEEKIVKTSFKDENYYVRK